MGDVKVTPGEIDEFAKVVAKLHDDWINPNYAAVYLAMDKPSKPQFGSFSAATTAATTYDTKMTAFRTAFQSLAVLLDDVRQTSEAIAKNYKDAESLAKATVADVSKALGESVADDGGPTSPPTV
jgi:ABC-type transporter Mla subunit MlaD